MKKLYILLLLVLAASCQTVNSLRMMKKASATRLSDKRFGSRTIPFRLINNQVIVTLQLESPLEAEVNFLLDTGAPTVLSKEFAEKHNIPFQPVSSRTSISTPGGSSGGIRFFFAKNMKININGLKINKDDVLVTDISAITARTCAKVDGIIGSDFLSMFGFYIDFSKKEITLYDEKSQPANLRDFSYKLSFKPNLFEKSPEVTLNINKVDYYFIWDTGYNGGMMIQFGKRSTADLEQWKTNHPEKVTCETAGAFADITGIQNNRGFMYYLVTDTLYSDKHLIRSPRFFAGYTYNPRTAEDKANIGISFMKNYKMYMSWKENMIYLNPDKAVVDSFKASVPVFSSSFKAKENHISIVAVNTASNAYKNGLRPGMILLKADEKPASRLVPVINNCNSDSIMRKVVMKSQTIEVMTDSNRVMKVFENK